MKHILCLLFVVLSGCGQTGTGPGVTPISIPPLPNNLSVKAEQLPKITDRTMGGLVIDGANTDSKYNDIAVQLNNVIDVYNCVRTAINTKGDFNKCF